MAAQNNIDIKIDINPSKDNDELIRNALHAFNVAAIGKEDHYSAFALECSEITWVDRKRMGEPNSA